MKLRYKFVDSIFIALIVIGGLLKNGTEIVKVKGFKNKIPFSQLKSLLQKDSSLELHQDKWYRCLDSTTILIKNELYNLVATDNKSKLVFYGGKLIDTVLYIIDVHKIS